MLSSTRSRVPRRIAKPVHARIRERVEQDLDRCLSSPSTELDERLRELAQEWDIERTLETNAAVFSFAGLALGTKVGRKWLMLPVVVAGFLLQHALHGWCPPAALFRRLGVRTAAEINAERDALKVLRGDFEISRRLARGDELLRAVQR